MRTFGLTFLGYAVLLARVLAVGDKPRLRLASDVVSIASTFFFFIVQRSQL